MAKAPASNDREMPFTRTNYQLLLAGLAIIVVGYMLMSGGGNGDPDAFNAEEIFSARRITVAPIVCLIGYVFVLYAIMKRTAREQ